MSAFDDLLRTGFTESRSIFGTDVTCNGITRKAVSTPIQSAKELQEAGYLPNIDVVIELLRTDFVDMGIADRSTITISGSSVIVLGIDSDDADPCIRLTCKHAR